MSETQCGLSTQLSIARWSGSAYCWLRVQADTDPMSVKCWASVTGQYPFSPSLYFMILDVVSASK